MGLPGPQGAFMLPDHIEISQESQEKKIPASNYFQFPNVVVDYWYRRLSPSGKIILTCLCRKIIGWHKTEDAVSRNQLVNISGLSRNSVKLGLDELESHGLLEIIQSSDERGDRPNLYRLIVEKDPTDPFEKEPEQCQNLGGGRSPFDQGGGSPFDHTKDILIQKKKEYISTPPQKKQKIPKSTKIKNGHGEDGMCLLTDEEYQKLKDKLGKEKADHVINTVALSRGENIQKFDKTYKSHYHTVLKWAGNEWTFSGKSSSGKSSIQIAKDIVIKYSAKALALGFTLEAANSWFEIRKGSAEPYTFAYDLKNFVELIMEKLTKLNIYEV